MNQKTKCRRCSECVGEEHHWLDIECPETDPGHPATEVGLEMWVTCKHCDAFAPCNEEGEEKLRRIDCVRALRKLKPKEIEDSWLLEEKVIMLRRSLENDQ